MRTQRVRFHEHKWVSFCERRGKNGSNDRFVTQLSLGGYQTAWEWLHKKAVNRFIKMLKLAASKLEITSLTKQLRLMSNLFDNYFYEIPRDHWEELFSVLQSQETTIRHSIMNEEGPIKKKNAENALNSFLSVLEDYVLQNDKQEAAA